MILKYLRIIFFVIVFQVDVAGYASSKKFLEKPEGCLKSKNDCAIFVSSAEGVTFDYKWGRFTFSDESLFFKKPSKSIVFLKGIMWHEGVESLVETEFGELSLKGNVWLIKDINSRNVLVRNVKGYVNIKNKDGSVFALPMGFESWISGVDSLGKQRIGVARPIDYKDQLKIWSRLNYKPRKLFKEEIVEFKNIWKKSVSDSSEMYQDVINRKVASIDEERKIKAENAKRLEIEKKELREKYRRKVLYGEN